LLHLVGSSVLLYLIDDARSNKYQPQNSFILTLSKTHLAILHHLFQVTSKINTPED